jgi:hypothetical protein
VSYFFGPPSTSVRSTPVVSRRLRFGMLTVLALLAGLLVVGGGSSSALAAGTGSISGNVQGAGSPNVNLQSTEVTPYDLSTGLEQPQGNAFTDAAGNFTIPSLPAGSYALAFRPFQSIYAPQLYGHTTVTVVVADGQAATGANVLLVVGATLNGNVKGQGTPNVDLNNGAVYLELNGSFFRDSYTNGNGDYTFVGLPTGIYTLLFGPDTGGNYLPQWWNNKVSQATADTISITVGQTVTGIDAVLALGSTISGTVTDTAGAAVSTARVSIYSAAATSDSYSNLVTDTLVSANGAYSIPGLPAGTYKVGFSTDATGYSLTGGLAPSSTSNYASQWYSGKYSYPSATTVTVATTGQRVSGINAVLENPTFADVSDPTYVFYPFIQWMASSGISTGTPQPSGKPLYNPANAVSRQAMASFLFKLSGETFVAPSVSTFADVDPSATFFTAIEWMASKGISTGTPQVSGKPLFKPTDAVSRQAMALFLARYAHANLTVAPTVQSFADVPVDAPAAAAVKWMKDTGISTGTIQPSGLPLYKPADPVSRSAMAAFLYRLAHRPALAG